MDTIQCALEKYLLVAIQLSTSLDGAFRLMFGWLWIHRKGSFLPLQCSMSLIVSYSVQEYVALKICTIRHTRYIESGLLAELNILEIAKSANREHPGYDHVNHLRDSFSFTSFKGRHLCLVLDVLKCNVRQLLRLSDERSLDIRTILNIARDVLRGLAYLHEECEVVHGGSYLNDDSG